MTVYGGVNKGNMFNLNLPRTCLMFIKFRVVDVGTEWRTFSNEKSDKDPSRVGASEVRKHV